MPADGTDCRECLLHAYAEPLELKETSSTRFDVGSGIMGPAQ